MKKSISLSLLLLLVLLLHPAASSAFDLTRASGDLENVTATWLPVEGATSYKVEVAASGAEPVIADDPLVRQYADGSLRVDVPGLPANLYTVKVSALDAGGNVLDEAESSPVEVVAHIREGFAFTGGNIPGAYNADGSLKADARVIYVTPATANTVTCAVANNKGVETVYTGLTEILNAYGKGYDKRPLVIRVVGHVADTDIDGLKDGNYINFQGSNNSSRLIENITIEGIGHDAALYGYGICFKRAHNIEVRNLAIMLFGDDAISMDTDNTNIWLHNIDFFYGRPGKDADQVKGDGSIDMKYHSSLITISFNHFHDSGKVMGCGGTTGESSNLELTFHHNWFDHADSRCPRLHYTTAHVYNNYYDGVPVYCIGNTTESSAFVEQNYFRNCKRPMMISGQGTDSYDTATGTYTLKGTFSGQAGGMTKAFDNLFAGDIPMKLVYQTEHATQFDAYLVTSRDEAVPESVVSVKGAWPYSNFDTAPDMYESNPHPAAEVPEVVTASAGRVDGGDLPWTFNNAVDDEDHSVNLPLKQAILDYKSGIVAIQGESPLSSGIATIEVDPMAAPAVIYDMQGRVVKAHRDALAPGIYVVRTGSSFSKISVR